MGNLAFYGKITGMKVVSFFFLPKSLRAKIKTVADLEVVKGLNLKENFVVQKIKDTDIAIFAPSVVKPVSRKILNSGKRLKHISLITSGYDWVDTRACKELGISISRTFGANSESVAEHTWALILALSKRIVEYHQDAKNKGACDFRNYEGVEVWKKTIGILGLGNIGKKVTRIAQGFEMKILAFDRSEKSTKQIKIVNLDTLLRRSDIITVSLPTTEETTGLIGKKEIQKMKKGVIMVNTTGDEIVDKKAVIEGIASGKIRGYGIDTAIMKPIPKNDPYFEYPNIIAIPHNAFNTEESNERVNEWLVENVVSFVRGKPKRLIKL